MVEHLLRIKITWSRSKNKERKKEKAGVGPWRAILHTHLLFFFLTFPSPLLLLILLSPPFCSKIFSAIFFSKGSVGPFGAYSLVCQCSLTHLLFCFVFVFVLFSFVSGMVNVILGYTQLLFWRDMWDLEANCKRISRTNVDCFGNKFVTFYV